MQKHEKLARALIGVILSVMQEIAKEDALPIDKQLEVLATISAAALKELNISITPENAAELAYEGLAYFTNAPFNYRNN